jgi:hypothetical protein
MLPTGETISPRSKFPDQPLSINQKPGVRSAALLECIPEWYLIHKGFFSVEPHTKFKDADAIANAIGCAPLPELNTRCVHACACARRLVHGRFLRP